MEPAPQVNKMAMRYGIMGAVIMLVAAAMIGASLAYVDQPQFCGSCHSMRDVYSTFSSSNHKQFTCGDCHLPQQNFLAKMSAKTRSGISHVYHETLKDYPEPLFVSHEGKKILSDNCRRCHLSTIQNTFMATTGSKNCTDCHRSLVHEEINLGKNLRKGGLALD